MFITLSRFEKYVFEDIDALHLFISFEKKKKNI